MLGILNFMQRDQLGGKLPSVKSSSDEQDQAEKEEEDEE